MSRLLLLFGLCVSGWSQEAHPTLKVGASAPDFSLPGVDGKTHSLSEYTGTKVLAIVFTRNHCPTAQLYEGRIQKLVADYSAKGVSLVAIQPNNPNALRVDEWSCRT